MDKFDKARFQSQKEDLERDGKPATWIGPDRHCSPFPDLKAGMPGILMPSDDDGYPDMFYPEAWKYRYPIKALSENVQVTGDKVQHQLRLL